MLIPELLIPAQDWLLEVDTPNPRLVRDRHVLHFAASWAGQPERVSGVQEGMGAAFWQDPWTYTIQLLPARLEAQWWTQTAGRYAKLTHTQVSPTAGTWQTMPVGGPGDLRMYGHGCAGAVLTAPGTFPANTGWCVGFFSHEAGAANYALATLSWGGGSVQVVVGSDGACLVLHAGQVVGKGGVGGSGPSGGGAGRWIDLVVQRLRTRDVLVWSPSTGEGFAVRFDWLLADSADQAVLPGGAFTVQVHSPTAVVQMARLVYVPTGTVYSTPLAFGEAPPTGAGSFARAIAVTPTGTSATASSATLAGASFSPNGTLQAARVRVDMASDGSQTPFVAGAQTGFVGAVATAANAPVSLMGQVGSLALRVADDGSATLTGRIWPGAWPVRDRAPARLRIGGHTVLEGDLVLREWEGGHGPSGSFEITDPSVALERHLLPDPAVFDGAHLADAVAWLASHAGYPVSIMDAMLGIPLPVNDGAESGDFALQAEVGDTPAQWLKQLLEAHAPGFVTGFRPWGGLKYEWMALDFANQLELARLFLTRAAAQAWLQSLTYTAANAEARAPMYTVSRSVRRTEVGEATEVRVTGWNPMASRPIQAFRVDTAAEAPGTAPALRPPNWVGRKNRFALFEPSLQTQAAVEACVNRLYPLLTGRRLFFEVECGVLQEPSGGVPLWIGDRLHLETVGDCVIRAFDIRLDVQDTSRSAHSARGIYTLEVLEPGTPWRGGRTSGWSADTICAEAANRIVRSTRTLGARSSAARLT